MTNEELLAKICDVGKMSVGEADDGNIPVCIFISHDEEGYDADDGSKEKYCWTAYASNFMPRRESVNQCCYRFYCHDRETAVAVIHRFWLPLYKAAVEKLEKTGELYYWAV